MRSIFQIIFISAFTIFLTSVACAQLCKGTKVILLDTLVDDGSNWILEFEDEFNGNEVDYSRWSSCNCGFQPDNAYRLADNVSVSPETYTGKTTSAAGVCKIVLKQEVITRPASPWDPNSPVVTYNYTAGDLWTLQKFGWGKYEIRCKVPKGHNFWSGFSTYGQENGIGNEINVFEFSNPLSPAGKIEDEKLCKLVEMHYHRWDKTQSVAGIDHNCGNFTGGRFTTDYSEDFHTFTIIWDRWGISWFIDGRLIKTVAQWYDDAGRAITKENIKPMQIVLRNEWFPTLQMIMGFGLNIKDDNNFDEPQAFPGEMLIDYVRYYKKY